ncbi:glycosyltransferase family 2 protein [Empedobacter brevis]|uniref:glycosyltransferase family 2 protein n=1 Tax=Empedobacter brevis TaxID=247 RepID=UPI00123E0E1E|nr:glycosyltransferase family A protein [Empedobacter brevis]QES91970.1 glycosyltransferase family 2 protein [Empedobacter brevis]
MVSVVIPLYNKENSILDTIHSVLNQTYDDFELLIINDGSTDNSLSVVSNIQDPRIKIIDKPNGGVSSARNVGILNSQNEYIAFLDGDDLWFETHLETLVNSIELLDKNDIGGIGTTFYKSENKIFDEKKFIKNKPLIIDDYFEFMSSPIPRFNSSTLMVKKSKIMETGLFDESLKYGEDVEFWYKLFSKYTLIYLNTITTIYFVAAENRSAHYVMPLDKRFLKYNYLNKSKSEKKYLDKLVALVLIDYFNQKAYKEVIIVLKMYCGRLFGVSDYILKLTKNKLKK